MRLRNLLASTGPVLLVFAGCTSDLPAPFCAENPDLACGVRTPGPPMITRVDCSALPIGAVDANYQVDGPAITVDPEGDDEDYTYSFSADMLPAGLDIDASTGAISGVPTVEPGSYSFDLRVDGTSPDRDPIEFTSTCDIQINPRIAAPLAADAVPYCLSGGASLLDQVVAGSGDGTPITCRYVGSTGDGRLPIGIEVDPDSCTLTGAIDERRLGTWVFIMEGEQSGATVHVPYCVTNNSPQGQDYELIVTDEGQTDTTLRPFTRTYDPTSNFEVGLDETNTPEGDENPRFTIRTPTTCTGSCYYRFATQRRGAPIGRIRAEDDPLDPCDANSPNEDGFCLRPSGLLEDEGSGIPGFYHELYMSGPPVPEELADRPWVISVASAYCLGSDPAECADVSVEGDNAFEFGIIMVPVSN